VTEPFRLYGNHDFGYTTFDVPHIYQMDITNLSINFTLFIECV